LSFLGSRELPRPAESLHWLVAAASKAGWSIAEDRARVCESKESMRESTETKRPEILALFHHPGLTSTTNRVLVLALSALLLCAVGFVNGYPLLYADSIEYLDVGEAIFAKLGSGTPGWLGQRSPFYSIWVRVLHRDHSLWFIIVGQGLVLSYCLFPALRVIDPKLRNSGFLAIILSISFCTSVSWYTSKLMPDIFASTVVLGMFVLGFGERVTSAFQLFMASAIVVFSVIVHTSHLPLALSLAATVGGIRVLFGGSRGSWTGPALRVASPIVVAIALMLTMTVLLFKTPELVGPHPPFLLARVVADGPGMDFLEKHCPDRTYAVCEYVDRFTKSPDDFLWNEEGVMRQASTEDAERIRREETRVVLEVLRHYPWEQARVSTFNFAEQLMLVGPTEFVRHPYIDSNIADVFPETGRDYFQSMQYEGSLPHASQVILQRGALVVSVILCLFVAWRLRDQLPAEILAFTILVVVSLLTNSLITGVLSQPSSRFQSRILWLIPLVAASYMLVWRRRGEAAAGCEPDGSPTRLAKRIEPARERPFRA